MNKKGVGNMQALLTAAQVSEMLQCSTSMAYKIMRRLNKELEDNGYITISGKINKEYLYERIGLNYEHPGI